MSNSRKARSSSRRAEPSRQGRADARPFLCSISCVHGPAFRRSIPTAAEPGQCKSGAVPLWLVQALHTGARLERFAEQWRTAMTSKLTYPRPIRAQPSTEPPPAESGTIAQLQREAAVSNNPRDRDRFEREQTEQIRQRAAPSIPATPLGGRLATPSQVRGGRTTAIPAAPPPRATHSVSTTDSVPATDAPVRGAAIAARLPQGMDHARPAAAQRNAAGAAMDAARRSSSQTATRPGR